MSDVQQGQPVPQPEGLKPRLLSGLQASFIAAEWPGFNASGLRPFGDYVLVKMDAASPHSAGGVILVDEQVERMTEAAESGCIFAVGVTAFKGLGADAPTVGDRVYIEKYAGIKARGQDGALYRIMECRCIAAGYDTVEEAE